ncbi:MAG: hypothetical protein J1E77_08055 [Prevotella sp.]|nr:hypothetical protein [Prevotella sp.]
MPITTVLIVSKTQMSNGICVGGIDENSGELVRIHNENGGNLKQDAPYEIGDRWYMNVERAWNARPIPHTEDKQTSPIRKINNVGVYGIINFINSNSHQLGNRLTQGSIRQTFEGYLNFQGTRNFINRGNIPSFSTQFWIADKNLILNIQFEKPYYMYDNIRIKFVGLQKPVPIIPAGTIIRLSLANWWNGDGSGEDRCYLQLSGWYI